MNAPEPVPAARPAPRWAQLPAELTAPARISDWLTLEQAELTAFGHLTRDPDPGHIDPAWARAHGHYGTTIAFGFQTLSMLTCLCKSADVVPCDAGHVFNYGFERVRFMAPVPVATPIRARFQAVKVRPQGEGRVVVHYAVDIQVRDAAKPALVAEWLAMYERAA